MSVVPEYIYTGNTQLQQINREDFPSLGKSNLQLPKFHLYNIFTRRFQK